MVKQRGFPFKKEDFPLVASSIFRNFASVKTKIRLNMKTKVLLGVLLMALPMGMMAQEDDAYFVPSKAKKKAEQEQYKRDLEERAEQQRLEYERLQQMVNAIGEGDFYVEEYEGEGVPDYHIGKLRNEDEYNRRGIKNYATVINGSDTLYYDEEMDLEPETRAQVNQGGYDYADETDYGYVNRLVRFHGGLSSRYYWDYNYNWAYDPWYRWGWSYDPWYWDFYGPSWAYYPYSYGWGYGHYGWYGYGYYGWHTGWYDPWYHGYYYGPGYWHGGNYATNYHRPSSSRRGGSLAGLSASRGTRNGSLADSGSTRGLGSTRTGSSASRGTGYRTTTATQRNDGRLTTGRTTTNSRTSTTTQRSTSTSSTSRTSTPQTTTSRTQSYTPTTTSSSSRGGGFSSSSSSSAGGGFSSGGGRSTGGGGGGGRGGR